LLHVPSKEAEAAPPSFPTKMLAIYNQRWQREKVMKLFQNVYY